MKVKFYEFIENQTSFEDGFHFHTLAPQYRVVGKVEHDESLSTFAKTI
jgi:hypothetical protein